MKQKSESSAEEVDDDFATLPEHLQQYDADGFSLIRDPHKKEPKKFEVMDRMAAEEERLKREQLDYEERMRKEGESSDEEEYVMDLTDVTRPKKRTKKEMIPIVRREDDPDEVEKIRTEQEQEYMRRKADKLKKRKPDEQSTSTGSGDSKKSKGVTFDDQKKKKELRKDETFEIVDATEPDTTKTTATEPAKPAKSDDKPKTPEAAKAPANKPAKPEAAKPVKPATAKSEPTGSPPKETQKPSSSCSDPTMSRAAAKAAPEAAVVAPTGELPPIKPLPATGHMGMIGKMLEEEKQGEYMPPEALTPIREDGTLKRGMLAQALGKTDQIDKAVREIEQAIQSGDPNAKIYNDQVGWVQNTFKLVQYSTYCRCKVNINFTFHI